MQECFHIYGGKPKKFLFLMKISGDTKADINSEVIRMKCEGYTVHKVKTPLTIEIIRWREGDKKPNAVA